MSRTVLVVDDDASVARLVGAVLAREGLTTELAADGPTALERLRADRFDLVLTDMTMPGMSGLELVHAAEALGLKTPFLLMSAFLDVETERQIFAEPGIAGVLRKPFALARLLDDVHAVLAAPAGHGHATSAEPCFTLALVPLHVFRSWPWPGADAALRLVAVRTDRAAAADARGPLRPEVLTIGGPVTAAAAVQRAPCDATALDSSQPLATPLPSPSPSPSRC